VLGPLTFPDRDMRALSTGSGDRMAIQTLMAGQYSRRALLVMAVLDLARRSAPAVAGELETAFGLLCDAQRGSPGTVAELLTLPHTGNWATACLRGDVGADGYRYLACLAATAALRAGQEFEVEVAVSDGAVHLPTVGTADINAAGARTALVRHDADGLVITAGADTARVGRNLVTRRPGWHPVHLLQASAAGHSLVLYLDDTGPFRAPPGVDLPPALTRSQVASWRQTTAAAWRIIVERHNDQAPALAAGLRCLVPLRDRNDRGSDSATATAAIGAVLLTPQHDPESLALTLLHEFQHTKLAALEDIVALSSADTRARYDVRWRDDHRPLAAVLHGAYAHLAVAGYWHAASRMRSAYPAYLARKEFDYWSAAVREALDQIRGSTELTATGKRFISGMTAALAKLMTLSAQPSDSAPAMPWDSVYLAARDE
jgi:HEXXH motif-containing protein